MDFEDVKVFATQAVKWTLGATGVVLGFAGMMYGVSVAEPAMTNILLNGTAEQKWMLVGSGYLMAGLGLLTTLATHISVPAPRR